MKKVSTDKALIPRYMIAPIIITLLCNHLAYFSSRSITRNMIHYDLTIKADAWIPFIPWTIVIYWGCYIYWAINYILACRQEKQNAYRFFCADVCSKLICLFFYLILPTTNIRPDIIGNSVFDQLMQLLYHVDAADNLFPSIHCSTSWFCFIAVRGNPKIPAWYKTVSFMVTVAICISTLTTKQHVMVDVAGGILLAEGAYYMIRKCCLDKFYGRWMNRIEKILE